MALPPLELPPIEKGSPCCRAALLLLRTILGSGESESSWREWRAGNGGRTPFVAGDVTVEVRRSSQRGICVVKNRRDSEKATLAQKLKTQRIDLMPTIAVSLTTVVMIAVLALVALAGRMEHDELE